ncbi:hypothetical protein CB0940_07380 [Cercospora beticola]|nr:hypothetical protein CB0940_07380 [Cercospora beticola]PIA89354.1 hypothetical protein CB0940_07380 [Cercospora beticola]
MEPVSTTHASKRTHSTKPTIADHFILSFNLNLNIFQHLQQSLSRSEAKAWSINMDFSGVQTNGLDIADDDGLLNGLPASVVSIMADQYIEDRYFSSLDDARADPIGRTVCAPQIDDLDAVRNREAPHLTSILESLIKVLEYDHVKPEDSNATDQEWEAYIQRCKKETSTRAIDKQSKRLSRQAERMGRFLLQEVYYLHEYGWHVDFWKAPTFRAVKAQYSGMKCSDRLGEICRVLSTCAPVAKDVMEGKNLERIASAPEVMRSEKYSFKKSNARRSKTARQRNAENNAAQPTEEPTEKPAKKRRTAAQHPSPASSPMASGHQTHQAPPLLPNLHPFTQSFPQQTSSNFASGPPPAAFQSTAGNSTNYGGNLARHDSAVDWSQGGYFGAGNEVNTGEFSFSMPPSQSRYETGVMPATQPSSQYGTGLMPAFQPSYGWGSTSYSGGNGNVDWNEPIDEFQ